MSKKIKEKDNQLNTGSKENKAIETAEILAENSPNIMDFFWPILMCFLAGLAIGGFANLLKNGFTWNEFINYINLYYPM